MDRPADFLETDLLQLMTVTLDAVMAGCPMSHADITDLRFAAAKHILAAIGAGERDARHLERSAIAQIRAQFVINSAVSDTERLPSAHRSSA
jgi:hypothetical protein